MCKRVVAAQGNNGSFGNGIAGLGNLINDGEYVRGRRRGKHHKILIWVTQLKLIDKMS